MILAQTSRTLAAMFFISNDTYPSLFYKRRRQVVISQPKHEHAMNNTQRVLCLPKG